MEPASTLPREIAEVLARGGTILTGNQRAARTLRLAYDRQRRAGGQLNWRPPAILAWDAWTSLLWREALLTGSEPRLLLNRSQELEIWRTVVAADASQGASESSLQPIESLAAMASGAWRQLCSYRGQHRLKSLGVSADTRSFQRWAQAFLRRCKSELYLSQSELEVALTAAVVSRRLAFTASELFLVGFDPPTPAQRALLDALSETGIEIGEEAPRTLAGHRRLSVAPSLADELIQAANWLRRTLEIEPETRIAVIHPNVAEERSEIDRVFRQILAPELQSVLCDHDSSPFEFSLGQPLLQQPMVATALRVLRFAASPLAIEEIGRLILSPWFLASPSQRAPRAEFDAFELRRMHLLRPELDLSGLIKLADGSRRAGSLVGLRTQLHGLLRSAEQLLPGSAVAAQQRQSTQKSFADWADGIRELLRAARWASAGGESSIEFQTRRKWESALDELSTLDFEGIRSTFAQALDRLENILRRTLFAPESREAPIQIMDPMEAAGSRFDALYFLRASDLSWPRMSSANPLLGWRLQHDLNMPGSDTARDMQHAARTTTRLAACAPVVVFSYAKAAEEGEQRPSSLLAALDLEPMPDTPAPETPGPIELEVFEDPGLIALPNPSVRGGAAIIKAQAQCGFRAFAEFRLQSAPLDTLDTGMDALERGTIVHLALAHLWGDLRSQAALRALTSEERSAQLDHSITAALALVPAAIDSTASYSRWDTAYVDIQRQRLRRLINSWLDLELARPPFEVALLEHKLDNIVIGPLTLTVRVDRVDRIHDEAAIVEPPLDENGEPIANAASEVIVDYKTGPSHPSAWSGDRPDEPQLPLYAAIREPGTVAAVAFASIRAGSEMGLKGIVGRESILPKVSKLRFDSLEAQIDDWRSVLTSLAEGFAAGDARVRPKGPKTCEDCHQRILCRVDPALLEQDDQDPDEGEAADG